MKKRGLKLIPKLKTNDNKKQYQMQEKNEVSIGIKRTEAHEIVYDRFIVEAGTNESMSEIAKKV